MRMPPLPADSIHARACKLKCEKIFDATNKMPIDGLFIILDIKKIYDTEGNKRNIMMDTVSIICISSLGSFCVLITVSSSS